MKVIIKRAGAAAVETIATITADDKRIHIDNSDLDGKILKELDLICLKDYYLAITLKQNKIFKDNENNYFSIYSPFPVEYNCKIKDIPIYGDIIITSFSEKSNILDLDINQIIEM